VEAIVTKAERLCHMLHARGCVRDALVPAVSRRLFVTIVRPCMEYACTVWIPSVAHAAKLDSIQASFARRALGLPSWCNSSCAIAELGLEPLWARRDNLKLLYWGYLTRLPRDRLLSRVFHATLDELDHSKRSPCGSVLAQYRTLLRKYDLEELWENRSSNESAPAWKAFVGRKVKTRIVHELASEAKSSGSVALLRRLHPSLLSDSSRLRPGPEASISDNFHGHWIKRMLRTSSLPLMSTLGKLGGWAPERMRCLCCTSGVVEDVDHFLHCPGMGPLWSQMVEQLRLGLADCDIPIRERSSVLRVVCGVNRAASSAALLGSPTLPVFNLKLHASTLQTVDRVVCLFLRKWWKRRVAIIGGVPMPASGPASAIDPSRPFFLSPTIWPPIRSRA
jgi:hypothetical protein